MSENLFIEYVFIKNIVYKTQPSPNDVSPGINRCGRVKIAKVFLQGRSRRKLLKVGGPGFEGHFSKKRASKNFFPESLKKFSDIPKKIFRIYHIFS